MDIENTIRHVVFRVDSSKQIGSGHLMRCMTLAHQLKESAKILFVCRDLEGNLSDLVKENGFDLFLLPTEVEDLDLSGYGKWLTVRQEVDAQQVKKVLGKKTIDWLVVDHYAIDLIWESEMRSVCRNIMVIDDLADRRHTCDVLLDQNYHLNGSMRYYGLVPDHCKLLLGPKYALLRPEFYDLSQRTRTGEIKNILVFFGGSDLFNDTLKALNAIVALQDDSILVDVVVGASNTNRDYIERYCNAHGNMKFWCQINNIAELMNKADLAIGAGGINTWERCYCGLPAIVIITAENQRDCIENCDRSANILINLGTSENVVQKQITEAIERLRVETSYYKKIEGNCRLLMQDSEAKTMQSFLHGEDIIQLIDFKEAFIDRTYDWISDEEHQKNFISTGEITKAGNQKYWRETLLRTDSKVYAIIRRNQHIGNCGFKNISNENGELWIYIGDLASKGLGYGKKALELLIQNGFIKIGLKRITLHVAKFNSIAIHLYEQAGFIAVSEIDPLSWQGKEVICMKLDRGVTEHEF